MDVRIIDLIRDMKKLIEEQGRRLNEIDNKFSSEMKKIEEKIILLENRLENYRFVVEKRYVPGIIERIESTEKEVARMNDRINALRVEWSDFRARFEARMREIETTIKSQEDFEVLMRKIKGLDKL